MKRVAVVTGANRGIGLEISRQLAKSGVHVVLTSRDPQKGEAAALALKAAGLSVEHHSLDVTDGESARALGGAIRSKHEGLDILVNNAGIALDGFNAEVARRTVEANFFGPLRVTDELLPLIKKGGRIVMVSSGVADRSRLAPRLRERFSATDLSRDELVGLMRKFVDDVAQGHHTAEGWPSSAYCVSKIGLNALTELFGRDLSSDWRGILCNAACPGWVRTGMGGSSAPRSVEAGAETPLWLAMLPEGGPQGGFFRDKASVGW
jgi:NAD(P)-dependent dehydrogenase (short-subunit alcohol dehydrogenase family)